MDIRFHIPGTQEPEITVRRRGLGHPRVLLGGVAAKQLGPSRYEIPLPDGSVREVQLKGQWTGLKAVVDGVETPLEPPLARIYNILAILPVVVGFLITGLIGGIVGTVVNRWLAGREMRPRVKVAAMLGVAVLTTAGSLVGSIALAPIPKFDTGSCVNGIRDGSNVLARVTRPADCKNPHDGEVVGTVDYGVPAAFPGDDALLALAQEPCLAAFASYVGIDYTSSSLEMGVVTPDDISWLKGDRQGACVVYRAGGGGKLTSSVKGSAH